MSVILFTLAAFFCVLALLAHQLRSSAAHVPKRPRVVVVRRVYQTTVVETVPGASGSGSGTSVSQSVSSSGSGYAPSTAAPTTRASG